jgi:hypothetical protein
MGGANTGRSNENEEVNHLEELCITTLIAHTRQGREAHKPPSETAVPMYHRLQSSHSAARSSHPQPKLHRKLLVDHDRRTNIQDRCPGLKVQPPI